MFTKCHQLKEHLGDLFCFLVLGRLALIFLSSSFVLWVFFFFSPVPVFSKSSPESSLMAQTVKCLPTMWETRDQSLPESGRSPAEGNGNALQYSCLENPMDRGTR